MCYAALVHEYFVILLWWRVCVMLLWCMSTLLSYYGGEFVMLLWCMSTLLSYYGGVCVMLLWCMSTLSYYGGECVLCCSGA